MRIGVALSGGGHRATAWGLGVLAALVETSSHQDVVTIASVSGGSITNGVVAVNGDFTALEDRDDFITGIEPTLRVVARDGLFFRGP